MAQEVASPKVLAIVDRAVAGSDTAWLRGLARLWPSLPADGSVWVQLRVKEVDPMVRRSLLREARVLVKARPEVPVLVNGTSGQALDLGYAGVHWPEALRPEDPPTLLSRLTHVSAAVHDLDGVYAAVRSGARTLVFSPVFGARSKRVAARGLDALHAACGAAAVPVLALGGVEPDLVGAALAAGAAGVAVLSPVSRPGTDAAAAIRELLDRF